MGLVGVLTRDFARRVDEAAAELVFDKVYEIDCHGIPPSGPNPLGLSKCRITSRSREYPPNPAAAWLQGLSDSPLSCACRRRSLPCRLVMHEGASRDAARRPRIAMIVLLTGSE